MNDKPGRYHGVVFRVPIGGVIVPIPVQVDFSPVRGFTIPLGRLRRAVRLCGVPVTNRARLVSRSPFLRVSDVVTLVDGFKPVRRLLVDDVESWAFPQRVVAG